MGEMAPTTYQSYQGSQPARSRIASKHTSVLCPLPSPHRATLVGFLSRRAIASFASTSTSNRLPSSVHCAQDMEDVHQGEKGWMDKGRKGRGRWTCFPDLELDPFLLLHSSQLGTP